VPWIFLPKGPPGGGSLSEEDDQLLRSDCHKAGKARGLYHNLIFGSRGIDLERFHAKTVTVAYDNGPRIRLRIVGPRINLTFRTVEFEQT